MNNKPKAIFPEETMSNISWMLMNKIIVTLIALSITVVLVKILGEEKYGVYALLSSFYGFIIIFCSFGLNNAIIRYIPELLEKKNSSNIKLFFLKVLSVQSFIGIVIIITLYLTTSFWNNLFKLNLNLLIPLTGIWSVLFILRSSIADALTSLLQVKPLAIVSIFQNSAWLICFLVILKKYNKVSTAVGINIFVIFLSTLVLIFLLFKYINAIPKNNSNHYIGKKRVFLLAAPDLLNQSLSSLLRQYSEIFFLGAYFPARIVGVYELGCTLPIMALSIIPLSTKNILTSAFSRIYVQDNSRLGELINYTHKLLQTIILPISALGFFFSPQLIPLIYGEGMSEASSVASFYSAFGAISIISIPYSIAIVTTEKIFKIIHLTVMQIVINVTADYLLIPKYGINGAIVAILITFLITYPIRLFYIRKIIGGLYLPVVYLTKVYLICYILAYIFILILPPVTFFTLPLVVIAYFTLYILILKYFKIIKAQDIFFLSNIKNQYIRKIINFVITK